MKNVNEPIVGGQYEWQGMPCAISNVEPSGLVHYKHLVTVEYFDKVVNRWSHLVTPFDGTFKLVMAPRVNT